MNIVRLCCIMIVGLAATQARAQVTDPELEKLAASLQADTTPQNASATASPVPAAAMNTAGPRGGLQSMNPDLSAILDVAAATFNTDEPLQVGDHDPRHPGFTLQQLELHIGANVDPFFRLDGNIVYKSDGIELEEAFATSLNLPGNLQLRGGQFLTRFGRLNSTHPHQWHFVDQPLVIGKFFGGDGDRDVGVELSWLSVLPWYAEVVVSATESGGLSYLQESSVAFKTLRDVLWTGALKQFFPLDDNLSLLWGLSVQTAPNNQDGRTVISGTDVYLRYRPIDANTRQSVSLQVETMWRHRTTSDAKLDDYGGYAELIWAMSPSWETGARAEYVTGLEGDYIEYDDTDTSWTASRDRYAAQVTYYPTHFSRVRLQGLAGHPKWLDHWIYGAFVSLEVVVGAHGAHMY